MSKYIKKYNDFVIENKISTEIPLPNDIIDISSVYIKAGKDIFLVGGAVRDFIQGIKPKDYDLVTNALPDESKKILKDFNVSDEQGKNFGVLRVYTKDEPEGYEIASYRRDVSGGRDTKGDDKKVEMGGDATIEDDCNRRDLTINSLFYDIKNKQIVDLVGGVDDIKKGIVRAVGDASQRFKEDRLRICRIFRFAARIGGEIESKTAQSIKNDNRLKGVGPKDDVSQERIWDELKKAWKQAKNYSDYLNFFNQFDMWGEVFPGSKINTEIVDSNDFVCYFANLFYLEAWSNDLERRLIDKYKVPIDIARKIVFLVRLEELDETNVVDYYRSKVKCHITDAEIKEWMRIKNIDSHIINTFLTYKPSVSSEELMAQGFKPGKALGDEIKRLEIENFKKML